jgi:hypothetical protein
MAINRYNSYYPTSAPIQRSSSFQVAGDVTGSGTSLGASNLGTCSGFGNAGTLTPSIPVTGTGSTGAAADQTYMPYGYGTSSYGAASSQPSVPQLLQQMVSMITVLMQSLMAQSGFGGTGSTGTPQTNYSNGITDPSAGITDPSTEVTDPTQDFTDPGTDTSGTTDSSTTTGSNAAGYPSGLVNGTTDPTQKAALDQSLSEIATDPVGSKLLNKAAQLGVNIVVGDPAAAAGANDVTVKGDGLTDPDGQTVAKDGTVQVNGVTLSDNKTGKITVVVRDPSNIKTIAHEMVHAVSTQDGNSKQEEGIADVIGSHVATDLGDTKDAVQGTDEQIYTNKQQYYPTLQDSNSIRQDLAALGINVDV